LPASKSSSTDAPLWAVILAGGVGSRFWPVSTPTRPKQILPLAGPRPLITETVARLDPLVPLQRLRILAGAGLAAPIAAAVPGLGAEHFLLEPQARGTAPVLAWAAWEIERRAPGALMASLHADHVIEPAAAFRDALAGAAALAARHGRLFTLGIEPTRPETGYGYLRVGAALDGAPGAYQVAEFVEKPGRAAAERYLASGEHLWNSGIFVWPAALLLEELRRHTPELAALLPLLEEGRVADYFDAAPSLSIDHGVLERSDRVGVLRAAFRWDDVGAWDAVARTHATDAAGNALVGDVHAVDASGCIAWAEEGSVALFGVRDLVVVRAGDVTLVADRDRAPELKQLLDRLPDRLRGPTP
jgi:mannose-1-phosphate guanylyltransferase